MFCCCCCKAEFNFSKLPSATGCKELEIEMPFLILFTGRNSAGEDSVALDCLFLSFFLFFPCSKSDDSDQMRQLCFFLFFWNHHSFYRQYSSSSSSFPGSHIFPSLAVLVLWSGARESNRITRWPSPSPENCAYCASLAFDILSFSPVVVVVIYCPLPLGYTLNIRQIWWKLERERERAREAVHQSIAAWQLPSGKLFAFLAFCSALFFPSSIDECHRFSSVFFVSSSSDADSDLFCCRSICTDLPISEPTSILFFLFFFFFFSIVILD